MYIQLFYLFFLLHYVQPEDEDLTCKDIRTFVDGHNSRRLLVATGKLPGQPAAALMNSVVWDKELATKAQQWASQHKYAHNPVTTVDSGRFVTVENIYTVNFTDKNMLLNLDDALATWFSEHKRFKYGPWSAAHFATKPPVGHYALMVWSDSIYIGCGVSQKQTDGVVYYVVCYYGPRGIYLGQKPYETGDATNKLACSEDCTQPYGDKCQ